MPETSRPTKRTEPRPAGEDRQPVVPPADLEPVAMIACVPDRVGAHFRLLPSSR